MLIGNYNNPFITYICYISELPNFNFLLFLAKPGQSAQVLHDTYTKLVKEKEELEKKLIKAKLLSKKLSKLKLSENFMSATDQDLLEKEIKQSTEMINKSVELNDQIKKLVE